MGIQIGPPCRGLRQDIALPAVSEAPAEVGDGLEDAVLSGGVGERAKSGEFDHPAVWGVKACLDALIVGTGNPRYIIALELPADEGSLLVLVERVDQDRDDIAVFNDSAGAETVFQIAVVIGIGITFDTCTTIDAEGEAPLVS